MKRKHAIIILPLIFILGAAVFFFTGKIKSAEAVKPSVPYTVQGTKILVGQSAGGITADTFRKNVPNFTDITEIDTDDNNKNYKSINGMLFTKDGNELIACPPGLFSSDCKVPSGVAVIGKDAFHDCNKISKIELPGSVSIIKANAFFACSFAEVTIPKNVTSIGSRAFAYNPNLQQITIPKSVGKPDPGIIFGCKDPIVCGSTGSGAQKLAESRNLIFQPLGTVSILPPKPAVNASDQDKMEYKISVILARLRPDMSDVEKVKSVNEYLSENVTYDMKDYLAGKLSLRTQSAVGAIVDGKTTCNGYSMAFHILMQQLGITDDYVLSGEMHHIWNMVKLDGSWYHVDVTWDRKGIYDNFLKSDSAIKESGRGYGTGRIGHYGLISKHKAVNTKYDHFDWANATPETINRGLAVTKATVKPCQEQITGEAGNFSSLSAVSNLGEALAARSCNDDIAKISKTSESDGKTSWKINFLKRGTTVIYIRSACNAVSQVHVTVL